MQSDLEGLLAQVAGARRSWVAARHLSMQIGTEDEVRHDGMMIERCDAEASRLSALIARAEKEEKR